jgi:transcriptional regulator with XRE-family HTH domain
MTAPAKPPKPPKQPEPAELPEPADPPEPIHVGEVIRLVREAAGWSRDQLSKQTGIATATIRNIEMGRHRPTRATLRQLLTAPCMEILPELVKKKGLSLGLGDNGIGDKTEREQ